MKPWLLVLMLALAACSEIPVANERASAPLSADGFHEPTLRLADGETIRNPIPPYPKESRNAREEGTVLLLALVGVEGRAKEVSVSRSSGYDRLDQSALETVRTWRFLPARQGDKPVEGSVVVPIRFSLTQ